MAAELAVGVGATVMAGACDNIDSGQVAAWLNANTASQGNAPTSIDELINYSHN